jgi:hypothetical protein
VKKNSRFGKSIRFPHTHQLRVMLGLNPKRLPVTLTELNFKVDDLSFRLLPSKTVPAYNRPHRLEVQCNVCNEWMSAGRFNQHQVIHPREQLSTFSKKWLESGR